MVVTAKLLEKYPVNPKTIQYIEQNYPDGIELVEIIGNTSLTIKDLHWIRQHFILNDLEFETYCKRCGIVHSENFWESDSIKDCQYIIKSSQVSESRSVFRSKEIINGSNIVACENVDNSQQIFESAMIQDSHRILFGKNITNGQNICKSTAIINGRNIIESSNVFNSTEIFYSKNIHNSHFIKNCENIKNCLFCKDIHDAEYCIFNLPVEKDYYEIFEKQYMKYSYDYLQFVDEWPDKLLAEKIPNILRFDNWYKTIPEKFWKWVRTLPNFDSLLIYDITMLPEILIN